MTKAPLALFWSALPFDGREKRLRKMCPAKSQGTGSPDAALPPLSVTFFGTAEINWPV